MLVRFQQARRDTHPHQPAAAVSGVEWWTRPGRAIQWFDRRLLRFLIVYIQINDPTSNSNHTVPLPIPPPRYRETQLPLRRLGGKRIVHATIKRKRRMPMLMSNGSGSRGITLGNRRATEIPPLGTILVDRWQQPKRTTVLLRLILLSGPRLVGMTRSLPQPATRMRTRTQILRMRIARIMRIMRTTRSVLPRTSQTITTMIRIHSIMASTMMREREQQPHHHHHRIRTDIAIAIRIANTTIPSGRRLRTTINSSTITMIRKMRSTSTVTPTRTIIIITSNITSTNNTSNNMINKRINNTSGTTITGTAARIKSRITHPIPALSMPTLPTLGCPLVDTPPNPSAKSDRSRPTTTMIIPTRTTHNLTEVILPTVPRTQTQMQMDTTITTPETIGRPSASGRTIPWAARTTLRTNSSNSSSRPTTSRLRIREEDATESATPPVAAASIGAGEARAETRTTARRPRQPAAGAEDGARDS
mmetsp:Transcript_6524/g.18732  ORF Transcript_6524/g.18732 Transcript_6524/m.18732 type:complete len:476 (-) Transcript_6524:289-1716(-)